MMARYFKIVEIDEDTFVNVTGETFDGCQIEVAEDGVVYVGVAEYEDEIDVSLDWFE